MEYRVYIIMLNLFDYFVLLIDMLYSIKGVQEERACRLYSNLSNQNSKQDVAITYIIIIIVPTHKSISTNFMHAHSSAHALNFDVALVACLSSFIRP